MFKKKAFTLVELLVVVAIIALLVSILLPAIGKARSTARRVVCGTRMHNLGLTIEAFKSDNDGSYPGAWWGTTSFNRRLYYESLIIAGMIEGEETVKGNDEWVVKEKGIREAYSCPSFRSFLQKRSNVLYGWSNTAYAEHYPLGIGYNSHLSKYDIWDDTKNAPGVSANNKFIGKIPNANTLVLIDSSSFFLMNTLGGNFYPVYEMSQRDVNGGKNGIIAGSHSGGLSNSLWGDMHVEARKADEYIRRSPNSPSVLAGSSILDHRPYAYQDNGYAVSYDGKIACPE